MAEFGTILFFILAIVLVVVGLLGAVLPALPGPPLSWVGLLVLYFATDGYVTTSLLLWMLALTIVVSVLDYVAPALMTKWGGGSKAATRGATIGTIIGLFFMPWGLLIGPLIGAFLGEMRQGASTGKSLRIAAYSFLSFLLSTGLKLVASLWMSWYILRAIWQYFLS